MLFRISSVNNFIYLLQICYKSIIAIVTLYVNPRFPFFSAFFEANKRISDFHHLFSFFLLRLSPEHVIPDMMQFVTFFVTNYRK